MENFVHSQNIEHFLRRLRESLPTAERRIFERLLAEKQPKNPKPPKSGDPRITPRPSLFRP
jgi:hypothetical protein